jgi:hypothetical protein
VEAQQAHLNLIVDNVFVNILDTNLKTPVLRIKRKYIVVIGVWGRWLNKVKVPCCVIKLFAKDRMNAKILM